MTWQMHTTMLAGLPELLNIQTRGGTDPADYVGAATWGAVYRSKTERAYYRIVPSTDASFESMQGANEWAASPARPSIAPIADVQTFLDEERTYYYIRYDVGGRQTLQDALKSPSPTERIRQIAKAVHLLPTWRNFAGARLAPMPAEIVFNDSGAPMLLAAPFRPPLRIHNLFDCPERIPFISAEELRGGLGASDDDASLYVFVAMSTLALYRAPALPAAEALIRAANRSLLSANRMQSVVPRWMDRLEAIREMKTQISRMLAMAGVERGQVDPLDFVAQLDEWARRCDPRTAVLMLQEQGRLDEANTLLREILTYEESLDLLMVGALLAVRRKSVLDAIEYLERAITLDPGQKNALEIQLSLITKPEMSDAAGKDAEWSGRLKGMLWRNFQGLPAPDQQRYEHDVAQFLIARDQFDEAARFAYERLFDAQRVHLWWKFDLYLDYLESLMGQRALTEAQQVWDGIKKGIDRATPNGSLGQDVLRNAIRRHNKLGRTLGKLRLESQKSAKDV